MSGSCLRWGLRFVLATLALSVVAPSAEAARIFALYIGPAAAPDERALFEIDPATGAHTLVAGLPSHNWQDLTGRPGEEGHIYSIRKMPGEAYENRVARIDIATGAVTDVHSILPTDLGLPASAWLELRGIAFAPDDASAATIIAAYYDYTSDAWSPTLVLFDMDMETGKRTEPRTLSVGPTAMLTDLSYGPGGALFTIVSDGASARLATIDAASGAVTELPCDECTPLRAFAIDARGGAPVAVEPHGELVRLSPSSGAVVEVIGQTGLGKSDGKPASVTGMALVADPEPASDDPCFPSWLRWW